MNTHTLAQTSCSSFTVRHPSHQRWTLVNDPLFPDLLFKSVVKRSFCTELVHFTPLPSLRGGCLHVLPAAVQVLPQLLQWREAQPPFQLPRMPLLGTQHLPQGLDLILHLQEREAQ